MSACAEAMDSEEVGEALKLMERIAVALEQIDFRLGHIALRLGNNTQPGAVIKAGSVIEQSAEQRSVQVVQSAGIGLPDLKTDKVVCWYGPNPAITRMLMDTTIAKRGAAIIGPLEFASAMDVAKTIAKVAKGERHLEYYRDKSDETKQQVHILLKFDMPVLPQVMADSRLRITSDPERSSWFWHLERSNESIHGTFVPDGPT